jgi:glucose/arabinose dehydrogenase
MTMPMRTQPTNPDTANAAPAASGGAARPARREVMAGLMAGSAGLLAAPSLALGQSRAALPAPVSARSAAGPLRIESVAVLENPWGLAFLPDARMLVTERPGRLRLVAPTGEVSAPIAGVPRVSARGQGGLLDVALAPDFAQSRTVFLSFAEPRADGTSATAVARGRLNAAGTALEGTAVIVRQQPAGNTGRHFGSRLVFARDGNLFVTTGDRGDQQPASQDKAGLIGKVLRVRPDGSPVPDNPFVGEAGAAPEIWSIGHRNAQGAALHPETDELWTIEHGARGGDEVNIVRKGANYGWPVISYGVEYSGRKIGEGTTKPGLEQPVHVWDPSIAPSGAAFYTASRMPAWAGSLFCGGLAGQMLVRMSLQGNRVTSEERLLTELRERIRDVRQGPDGWLYLLTDSGEGRILRVRTA